LGVLLYSSPEIHGGLGDGDVVDMAMLRMVMILEKRLADERS